MVPAPFRVLGPTSLSAVVAIDDDGIIVGWSDEAELVFGLPPAQALGRRLSETIIPERYREAHEAGLQRFRETGRGLAQGRIIEAYALRSDGSEFPAELAISPPVPVGGGRHHFTAFVRDLTERRRLEQVHATQFTVTRILAGAPRLDDAAPEILAAIGENLGWAVGLLWVRDTAAELLRLRARWTRDGMAAAEEFAAASAEMTFTLGDGLPGRVWEALVPVAMGNLAAESHLPRARTAAAAGLHGAVGFPIVSGQQLVGVVEFLTEQVQPPDPVVLSAVADLGSQLGQFVEHRLAEDLLRRRVHELEVLQRAAHALSASLDLDVVLDAVARTAAEALGAPRATVLRRDGDDLVIAGEYDETGTSARGERWPVGDLPGAERVLRGEFWTGPLQGAGPTLRQVTERTGVAAVGMAPVRSGSAAFGILALLSRSQRRLGDDEMRLLQGIAGLAGMAVGNAESFRMERAHARRMSALETAKAQFLNLASHELRSPLTVLRGYLSMISEGTLGTPPEPMARVVPLLTAKLAHMNALVDEMLETARLEDDRLQLSMDRFDLRDLVRGCVRSCESTVAEGQRLLLEVDEASVPVSADATRVETTVKNLIDNALKYSPNGGDVECRVALQGGMAVLTVSDHGLGIAPDDMASLFTRFGRIVTAENSHIPGTGLGLYLAREMTRMQGGDISAVSTPGEGSTFTLWLPTAPAVED